MANEKVISTSAMIAKFEEAYDNKWGYIYGKSHDLWNATKQAEYNKAKKDDPDCQNSITYGSKWYGHWVTDCSGLFHWAFAVLGGTMYHGSNTMYNSWCTAKGKLSGGKRTDGKELKPGTAVFTGNDSKHGHVGLYIGNGIVIEAEGAKNGVIKSNVTKSKWTYWGELKGVDYGTAAAETKPDPIAEAKPEKGYAIVTGTNLALREGPTTNAKVLTRAPTGSTVKITEVPNDWVYVTYGNKTGFMMKKYLKEG